MSDAPRQGSAGWRSGERALSADSARGVRRFIALAALLAAAGAVVGVLFWIRPADPPILLTFPISEYKDPVWPPNPWAEEDSDAIQGAFPELAGREKEYAYQELSLLQSKLQSLRNVKASQPVILHLSALGAVHGGVTYVVPGDGKPGEPSTWLKLDTVLDAFAACPAKHRLLLLDLAHPIANLFQGPLSENVADRLDEHLRTRADSGELPYFVLTSCSKGELSLPMDEEQQSAFAFYLGDGLRGAAEGFGPKGQLDGRVRVQELAAYVTARVGRWARDCRDLRQTPKLYGDFDDFDLTDRRLPPPEPKAARAYPEWLLTGWKQRDDWIGTAAYRRASLAVNAIEFALLPAEQDWQAMSRPERAQRIKDDLATAVDQARTIHGQAKEEPPPPLRTLTAWPLPTSAQADWSSLLESFLTAQATAANNPKDADKAKEVRAAFLAKVGAAPEARKSAAALIWRRLVDDAAPLQETVTASSALLDEVQPVATTESQVVRRLAAWQRPGGTPWPPAAARQMLHAEDAASRSLAAAPGAFPSARELFSAAAKQRDDGEALLFEVTSRTRDDQARATDILKQAEAAFTAAAAQMGVVESARRAVEDAAIVLPATAGRVAEEGKAIDERGWLDAAKAAVELNDRLERVQASRDLPLGEWESATGRLTAALHMLQARYQPLAVKRRLEELGPGGAPQYQTVMELLRGPMLFGPERKKVSETAQVIAERLHKQTRDADLANDDARRPPGTNRSPDPPLREEPERRQRRAMVSIELLRVAGLDKVDELEAARRAAQTDDKKWETLAAALRVDWTDRLPHQAKTRRDKQEWVAADRRERFLLPELVPAGRSAAVEVRRRDQAAYLDWLEGYYRGLGRLRQTVPNAHAFYEDAAEEARRARGD